jgi:hypothetical protein
MSYYIVGFEVLTAMSTKMAVFWVVVPCKLLPDYTALQPRRQPSSRYYIYSLFVLFLSLYNRLLKIYGSGLRWFYITQLWCVYYIEKYIFLGFMLNKQRNYKRKLSFFKRLQSGIYTRLGENLVLWWTCTKKTPYNFIYVCCGSRSALLEVCVCEVNLRFSEVSVQMSVFITSDRAHRLQ